MTKGVESVITILQGIAKQRPAATTQSESQEDQQERPATANSAHKRSEKVRAMIDFALPSDTLSVPGVTESNLIQYLGLVEHKANELLTLNFLVNSPKKAVQLTGDQEGLVIMPAGGVAGLLGQGPTAHIGNLTIIPPSTA